MGHLFGMPDVAPPKHENCSDPSNCNKYPKDWDCGPVGSIVNNNWKNFWSPCNVMDFRRLYNKYSATNQWCMEGMF